MSRRSVRTERRLFVADGPKAVEGALGVPDCVVEIFATPDGAQRYAPLLGDADVTLVDDRAMSGLSDSVNPAGLVAVCRFLHAESAYMYADSATGSRRVGADSSQLVAICVDVRDPGNAGTVIRCADAAGADGVVLAGDAVDLHNPKTIRASVGSAFHLPIAVEHDPLHAVAQARSAGLTVLAADMDGESLFETDLSGPTAWLFGNEAWGLADELRAAADRVVSIPIYGRAESLNLSTAAALCLYASARAHH